MRSVLVMGEEERVVELEISVNDVAQYMFPRLLELGYAVTSDEILDIADILFDFLIYMVESKGE